MAHVRRLFFTVPTNSTPTPGPALGNYPNASISLSADTTVMPDAAPTNTTSVSVYTSSGFNGKLEGDPLTGVVRVTDAHPAGVYTVTVAAFDGGGLTTTKTFTLTITAPTTCNPASFASANFSAATRADSVAVGDFNRDGKQDLVVANLNSNNVSILLGDGAGSFSAAANFGAGTSPNSVAVGDFNGDGKQDLAVANIDSNNVSILLGIGTGGFSSATNFGVGAAPVSVAAGDFNGDGRLDLVVTNVNSNNVSILLGDGNGSFSVATNFGVGAAPVSVAAGDFNGDGHQDLAVANQSSNNISILLGDGAGSFSAPTNFGAGTNPESVAIGDFNGDSKQDLAVANVNSNNVSILLGDGSGGFSAATNFGTGNFPNSLAVGDFNGDGQQDLAVANESSNNVSILLGDGAGNFSVAASFGAGAVPYSVAVGDFDGDGKQDFAIANFINSHNVAIFLGNCGATPTPTPTPPTIPSPLPVHGSGRIAFSSTRNGGTKIFTMNPDGSDVELLTNLAGTHDQPTWSADGAKIAFESIRGGMPGFEIYTMSAYGSNQTRLTTDASSSIGNFSPHFSPDGTKIAFWSTRDRNSQVYSMNADGTNQVNLSQNGSNDGFPEYSPDGTKIVFVSSRDDGQNTRIYLMNADGSNQTRLTNSGGRDQLPTWSPDGTKIAFNSTRDGNDEIYVMNADGSNQTRLTNNTASDIRAVFSPDETKIVFASNRDGNFEVYVMNADGTNQINLTSNAALDNVPDWQPLLTAATPAGGNVSVQSGNVTIAFPNVTSPGTTVAIPIDPNSAGSPPPGFTIDGTSVAYDISTTATITPPIGICISVPGVTEPVAFSHLRLLHLESGALVDRTTGQNFLSKLVCGSVNSLSPFVIANGSSPTATTATIGGHLMTTNNTPLAGAAIELSGTQSRVTTTDANGNYSFDNVETNGFYTVTPSHADYLFTPANRSFSLLGSHTEASFTASPDGARINAIDTNAYFVRQQYLDFLGREPDEPGLDFWIANLESCGTDQNCLAAKRIDTSAAFFFSVEFQQTGFLVYRTYRTAYGEGPDAPVPIKFNEFLPDTQKMGQGLVVGQGNWEQALENNQQAFANDFVQRSRFATAFPITMTPAQFVDKLNQNTGNVLSAGDRANAIASFGSATDTSNLTARAQAVRQVAENATLNTNEFNRAFVLMQFFGYLRRDPNTGPDTDYSGFDFWLTKLNQFNGNYIDAEMVKAFITSLEYRQRFGQ